LDLSHSVFPNAPSQAGVAAAHCHLLVTGVGQLQCAVHLARALARSPYSLVVQAGLAGSFTSALPKRAVVRVSSEVCADLGAEDRSGFLDLRDMGLLDPNVPPFKDGVLVAPELPYPSVQALQAVSSVTVNRVLSAPESIAWVRERYAPHVVNMEGAACFYAALLAGVPFVQLRAISDMVGPRDRAQWDIPGAVMALDEVLQRVLQDLTQASLPV
jgi:futalosine hydrolase